MNLLAPLVLFMAASLAAAQPMKLFILSGQSNCVGNGDGDKLPAELASAGPDLVTWSRSAKTWTPLAPVPSNPVLAKMYQLGATQFGPEISLGHALQAAYPDRRIGIVKVCIGGTSVLVWSKDFGSPEWTNLMAQTGFKYNPEKDGFYQGLLLPTVRQAIAGAQAEGAVEVAGFIWVQAEKDSDSLPSARAWAARVFKLHSDLAADAGYPEDIPLVVMGPHFHVWEKGQAEQRAQILAGIRQAAATGQPVTAESLRAACGLGALADKPFEAELVKMKYWVPRCYTQIEAVGIMQRGLDELARQHPNVRVVRSDDLPTHEGLHFDTEGQLELGRRLAHACRE